MPRMLDLRTIDTPPVDAVPAEQEPTVFYDQQVPWRLATRIAFRLTFVYISLYVLTTQMLGGLLILPVGNLPNLGATGYMKGVVSWTATHVFKVTTPFMTINTGSGDKTVDWVHAFCLLVFAVAVSAAWSIADRKRANYVRLNKWFRIFLRFAVGATMIGYGMVKAIPLQMPAPSLQRLVEPFGNFSPMGVLWYSVGASFPYERFAGFAELTGAVLLFVPPLAVLGALVVLADSIQIFTLNMTYDVPVKLFSFHLIVMCLVLLAPEVRRLVRAIVVARPRRLAMALQLAFAAYIIGMNLYSARQAWMQRGGGAPKSPLYGIWNVEEMQVDGVLRAGLIGDYGRWRRLIFQNPTSISFQRMDDSFQVYGAKADMNAKTLALTNAADKNWGARFAIQQQAPDRMVLEGEMDGHKVRFDLHLYDRSNFLLLNRGFSWIQERPFNR